MPRKLPPHVEPNHVKGKTYLSFRIRKGKGGPRIRLPDDPTSQEFRDAYAAAMAGETLIRPKIKKDAPGSIGALIASYKASGQFKAMKPSSKAGYMSRLETIRIDHGHRAVAGLTKDRINSKILTPLADRPGAALDTLKKLRILIKHAIEKKWLAHDPSVGIKRPKSKEIRAWTDAELAAFERRWPIGTKQRTAYALMLNMGTARVDTHLLTWRQVDDGAGYTRHKTGIAVDMAVSEELQKALAATPRKHVTVINTEYGKPFSVDGFSGFMRDAITKAGLPLDCQPHGLRKTLGRMLADAGASTHDIMAALGHTTLSEAERYTREADRRRGGKRAVTKLDEHRANKLSQTAPDSLGKAVKTEGKSER
ncbi:tyrosine-type recombinase/integrase [Bradyrhizobium erythrophlei]|uniref:Phage integrase family protein n=1 Tax=Bradyrhizobium erythrophlei TaxID=1437360 RepID=A0A1M7TEX3_9BRAD|nr:tyrosine-type recombinase/integrase [Bradyrhizobium erythrophlei]SHN69208.1 Phage integrase family protein [Bradyrhizobium erythrophlei]